MLRVVRIDNHTVKHPPVLKERPELLPPQHGAVVDVVSYRGVVVLPRAHIVESELLREVFAEKFNVSSGGS